VDIFPGPRNLEALITDSASGLTVPALQRGYEWEKTNIDQFFNDITASAASGEGHFFGPVVVLKKNGERTEVIDGQQRITTAFIALSLLRDEVFRLKEQVLHAGTADEIPVLALLRKDLFFTQTDGRVDVNRPRFSASRLIRGEFNRRILQDPISGGQKRVEFKRNGPSTLGTSLVRDTKDLRSALFRLKKYLDEDLPKSASARLQRIYNLRHALLMNFEIFTLEVTTDDDAYSLFETLNDRGLRLSTGDLLRTVLLRGIADGSSSDEVLRDAIAEFDEVRRALGAYDLSRFMRHFLLTTTIEQVQKARVMNLFRERIKAFGNNGSRKQLHELQVAAEKYALVVPSSDLGPHPDPFLSGSVNRLQFLNETHRVALLGALMTRTDLDASDLGEVRSLFRSVEYLTFRWLLDDGNAQQLEKHYQLLLKEFRAGLELAPRRLNGGAAIAYALQHAPKDRSLATKAYATTDREGNLRYVLYRLEQSSSPQAFRDATVTLEHLAPVKPQANSNWYVHVAPSTVKPGEPTYAELVEEWGNCTLLPFSLNSSLSNGEWRQKIEGRGPGGRGLSTSRLNINQQICKIPQWSRAHIVHRTKWLSETALELVSEDWVRSGREPATKIWSPDI